VKLIALRRWLASVGDGSHLDLRRDEVAELIADIEGHPMPRFHTELLSVDRKLREKYLYGTWEYLDANGTD